MVQSVALLMLLLFVNAGLLSCSAAGWWCRVCQSLVRLYSSAHAARGACCFAGL